MKKRIVKRMLSTALAASMILGNVGLPQGLGEVRAAQTDIDSIIAGKTEVTDDEIKSLYRDMSYTPQAVHDPSVIKGRDGSWYVFGSHRGVAKTSDLQNWTSVNIDGLFGDGEGKVLDANAAFSNSLFTGTIQVAGAAGVSLSAEGPAVKNDAADGQAKEPVAEPEKDETEQTTESPEVAENETVPAPEQEQPSETASEPETVSESETAAEPESISEEGTTQPEGISDGEAMPAEGVIAESVEENAQAGMESLSSEETTSSEENLSGETAVESEGTVTDDSAASEPETEAPVQETVSEEPVAEAPAEETAEQEESSIEESSVEESIEVPSESAADTDGSVMADDEADTAVVAADEEPIVNELAGNTVTFGSFDAGAWCTASEGWTILSNNGSNMWAPDIIYNDKMNKYCMYLSLNGQYHNSVVVLLTSDSIEGPYAYQGPVVYSGFTAQENVPTNYKKTDIKYVLGENAELPARYQQITNVVTNENGKITDAKNNWGEQWPHAIDPAVFYDDAGNLWMIYGSWSGGIYSLQLDENTGLRDYTVTYDSDFGSKGQSVTSDPYFGKKIAGGYYNSGEGPYIEKIGNYYYLFMSYGFYAPNGGYSMRIFRSENPDGPYVDTNNISAIYDKGIANFIASYAQDVSQIDTRGMRLMTYYKWDHMSKGEVAQGHNSAIVDDSGRAYVIYHTKFNNNTADHELRVHELFQNKNGWILASPFAFANDAALNYDAAPTDVAGDYEILMGDYSLGYDKDSSNGDQGGNYTGPLAEIVTYTLTSDGKVKKGEQEVGAWSVENGKAYADLTINGKTYSGVFAEVTKDSAGIKTLCFTGVDETTGITLWGAKKLSGKTLIADNVENPAFDVPSKVYGSFELPSEGNGGAKLYWKSSDTTVVADDGTIAALPANDTDVTFTMTMVSGDYYYQKDYTVIIAGQDSMGDGKYLVGTAYKDNPLSLPDATRPSMPNPFYKTNTYGLELSGGVSIEFDVKHTGEINALGALFAFNDNAGGKLYFTQASYLGYNALGGYYDANLNDYKLVKDYIGEAIAASGKDTAHVSIHLNTTGFEVFVDEKLAYDQTILTTENGAATLTDHMNVLTWLQSSASTLCMGYGSWWDAELASAAISNMEFYVNQSNDEAVVDGVIAALTKQMPESTMTDISLPVEGAFGAAISWQSSHPDIIGADGKVTTPGKETTVTLTATVTKGQITKTAKFDVVVKIPATSNVVLERELLEITSSDQIERIDNPFFGKNLDSLVVDYDIIFSEKAAKNGWDGIFAFYNSETNGRVSFQTNPYICLNEFLPAGQTNPWLDINKPDNPNAVNIAATLEKGQEYNVKIIINKKECRIYLDGQLVINADEKIMTGVAADFAELLDYVGKCDKFSWGVGNANEGGTAFWNTELCTLKNIRISSNEYKSDSQEEVVLKTEPTVMDNPLYGKKLNEVVLDFTVNYAEDAAMNGWDGLLSFFQPSTGAADGRVSIQTAPYICYNANGAWMDINHPKNMLDAGMEIPVTKLSKGMDYHYYISISSSKVTMEIDGKPVELNQLASSATVSYQDILNFISTCQKFSWGVVMGETCFWGMEKCTLKDASVKGYYSKEYTDVEEDNQKVTVTLHYPDGTDKKEVLKRNSKLNKPESEGEDENGKYIISWYTDEAKTVLYDFSKAVTGDMDLYGSKNYNLVTVTLHYPDGTTKEEVIEKNTKFTKPESEGEDENGKYTINWYSDEAKTVMYDFETVVAEDLHLYGDKNYAPVVDDNKVTVTLYYPAKHPDGTVQTVTLEKNAKLQKPVYENSDANGKYGIKWYADEAKTVMYDFDQAVTEDISIYGIYYYYYEEPGKDENGDEITVPTGIWVERIDDQQYTGAAIKPLITVYDGTKKLKEKVDYKVSYSDNKKVSTDEKPAKVTITPCGNYEKASKFSINFKITQRELTKENVTVNYKPEMNVKYDKKKAVVGQTQKISVKFGKVTVPAREYTVTYKKGEETVEKLKEEGTYQLVIKTKDTSSFAGELIYDIVVTDKILTSALKFKVAAQNYSGQPLTPDVTVTYKGKSVVPEGKTLADLFDIEYQNNVNAGMASVILTAKPDSDYYGSKAVNFKVNGIEIKKAAMNGFLSSKPFTGEAVTQDVTLLLNKGKADERTLQAGTDYDVTYTNNINAGKATMTVTGKGEFSGSVKKTFTIGKINLKQAGTDVTAAFVETAQPLKVAQDKSGAEPAVTVTYKGTALVQDKDYKVVYSGNKAVGANGKVTIKGIGNYTGDLKNALTFEITPKDISDASITVTAADLKYAANGKYRAKLTVYDNGVKLASSEYTAGAIENITMTKNEAGEDTQCGTAEVTITGKKNYTGTRTVTVQIRKTLVSSAKIKVNGAYYYANGAEIRPAQDKLEVTIGSGSNKVTLTPGVDFDIESYGNNTMKGNATVTIKGIGEYGGTKSVKFKILPKWMKKSN